MIAALVLVALVIVGAVSCTAMMGKAADDAVKSDAEPGGPDNPLTVQEGQAFEVRQFNYASGWKVVDDGIGGVTVKGLKVTNNRESPDGAIVEVKFMKGSEVLQKVDCSTEQVLVGTTTTLSCVGSQGKPTGYDKITINDTF